MNSRGVLYACATALGLAAALHLCVPQARGQGTSNPVVGSLGRFVLTADGDVYQCPTGDGVAWLRRGNAFGSPSTADPLVGSVGGPALTAGGNVYQCPAGDGVMWVFRGNVFGAPTPTAQASMGTVKTRYR